MNKKQKADNRTRNAKVFTTQVRITLPKHQVERVNSIADDLNIPSRYVIWDAIDNYLRICKRES